MTGTPFRHQLSGMYKRVAVLGIETLVDAGDPGLQIVQTLDIGNGQRCGENCNITFILAYLQQT